MAIFITGATQKLSRTTNLVSASSNYTCMMYVRPRSVPGGGDYISFMVLKNAGYTAYAGLYTQNGSLATNIEVNNGGGQFDTTQSVLTVATWCSLAYVRNGTNHRFYKNTTPIGNATSDFSAVTWTELLIGYDGFSVSDFDIWGFREFDSALTDLQVRLELESAVPLNTPVPFTTTPLFTDLLDDSGNTHTWTASPAGATFVTGPADTGTITNPLELLTGTFVRFSGYATSRTPIGNRVLDINAGMTLGTNAMPFGGRTIARVTLDATSITVSGAPGAQVVTASHSDINVYYMDATTFALVLGGVIHDPWVDPAVGLPAFVPFGTGLTLTYGGIPAHRLALAIKTSTKTGSTYASDGALKFYIDDVEMLSLTGLHFASSHPFSPSPTIAVGYGNDGPFDRVWARLDFAAPGTTAQGALTDSTDLWYFEDFAVAEVNPVAWGIYQSKPSVGGTAYPHTVSDVGGSSTACESASTGVAATLIEGSGPFLNGDGIARLQWEGTPSPTPPTPLTYSVIENPIRRLRRAPHLSNEHKRLFYPGFELEVQRGVGILADPGRQPQIMLRVSRNGGQTWGSYMNMSAGALGEYKARPRVHRLGTSRDMVFEITTSDPNDFEIINAWLTPDPIAGDS